ncbi:DUF5334 family protein [Pseudomonas putida]|uniref:DUF5334 family protein n=1 Tax=Pseudomonas putida TaxID=303 RepID=UPI0035253395
MLRLVATVVLLGAATAASAWSGSDASTAGSIEIESGNLVRQGETIEFYDSDSGDYRSADVESINSYGGTTEVEVYDHDAGEYRTFEMDD